MQKTVQRSLHSFFDIGIPVENSRLPLDARKHALTFNKQGNIDFVHKMCIYCGSKHIVRIGTVLKQVLPSSNPEHRFRCEDYRCQECGHRFSPIIAYALIYDAEKELWNRISELEVSFERDFVERNRPEDFGEKLLNFIDELYTQHLNIPVSKNAIYTRSDIIDLLLRNFTGNQTSEMSYNILKASGMHEDVPSSGLLMIYLGRISKDDIRSDVRRIFDVINAKAASLKLYSKDIAVPVAIDFHLQPYFGRDRRETVSISKKESNKSSSYAFKYATADVVVQGKRLTLYGQHISQLDSKITILQEILDYLKDHVKIKYLLMDREFFTVEILKMLNDRKVKYIVPIIRNKSIMARAKEEYLKGHLQFQYRFGGKRGLWITVYIYPNEKYDVSRPATRENPEFFLFTTNMRQLPEEVTPDKSIRRYKTGGDEKDLLRTRLPDMYRARWGIETDYRVLEHEFRAMTTSNKFTIRYLYFFSGVFLRNIWELSKLVFEKEWKRSMNGVNLRAKIWKTLVQLALDGKVLIKRVKRSVNKIYTKLQTLDILLESVARKMIA